MTTIEQQFAKMTDDENCNIIFQKKTIQLLISCRKK